MGVSHVVVIVFLERIDVCTEQLLQHNGAPVYVSMIQRHAAQPAASGNTQRLFAATRCAASIT